MQNDLNQHFLDFGWRQYDPVIARWHVTDPTEQFYNPYLAISGNPVSIIDPDGRKGTKPPWEDAGNSDQLSSELNGFGGGAGGGGMGRGSLASLNPYDMQQLANAHGTAIINYGGNMCVGCSVQEMTDGTIVINNTNTGTAFDVINNANSSTNYYINSDGEVVPTQSNVPSSYSSANVRDLSSRPLYGAGKKLRPLKGANWASRLKANFLRYSPFLGLSPNPFYMAEAIYSDVGFSIVGAEFDVGSFFILTGKEIGRFISYSEIAGGFADDITLGGEIGRIDISGSESDFTSKDLFGFRSKAWITIEPGGVTGLFIGGSIAWSSPRQGLRITARALQIGFGASVLPFVIGGGFNQGTIEP